MPEPTNSKGIQAQSMMWQSILIIPWLLLQAGIQQSGFGRTQPRPKVKLSRLIVDLLSRLSLIPMVKCSWVPVMISWSKCGRLMTLNLCKLSLVTKIGLKVRNFQVIQEWLPRAVMIAQLDFGMFLWGNKFICLVTMQAWWMLSGFILTLLA